MAAGPTVIDMAAQGALFYGVMIDLLNSQRFDVRERLPFIGAWNNFYEAARNGLKAQVSWLDGKKWPVQKLIVQELVPAARRGLESLQVDAADIDRWLQIVVERAESGRTGAQWQLDFFEACGRDRELLVKEYRVRQLAGERFTDGAFKFYVSVQTRAAPGFLAIDRTRPPSMSWRPNAFPSSRQTCTADLCIHHVAW